MGAFDDLIPSRQAVLSTPRFPRRGNFDDLIPQVKPEAPQPIEIPAGKMLKESIKAHPLVANIVRPERYAKAILGPIPVTKEGKSLGRVFRERFSPTDIPIPYPRRFAGHFATGIMGDVLDIATTPANYAIAPLLKVAGPLVSKIPVGKSALGRISKVPIEDIPRVFRGEAPRGNLVPRILPTAKEFRESPELRRSYLESQAAPREIKGILESPEVFQRREIAAMVQEAIERLPKAIPEVRRLRLPPPKVILEPLRGDDFIVGPRRIFGGHKELRKRLLSDIGLSEEGYIKIGGKEKQPIRLPGPVAPKPELGEIKIPTELSIPVQNTLNKVIQALQEAKPIRKAQEKLYTIKRGERLGKAAGIAKTTEGRGGFYRELGQLKGELPKVQYESIVNRVTEPEITQLFEAIKNHPRLDYFETIQARTGLNKLFAPEGGVVPTESELSLLKKVFGNEFIKTLEAKKPFLEKLKQLGLEIGNMQRVFMASVDMSAPFRQGIFMIGRPKQFVPAFKEMFKLFFNEKAFQESQINILRRPTYGLMKQARLMLTDIDVPLAAKEEKFMSNLAESVPVAGRLIRASNRAYVGFLNKLRADVFDDLLKAAKRQGIDLRENPNAARSVASFINHATGRGELGSLERAAVVLNSLFFSPRLVASRINLLNPVYYMSLHPFARKEALKSLASMVGIVSTILGLSKLGGAEVETDIRSADFGKTRFGNTRYDIAGGFQQYVRLLAQLFTGTIKSSTTGNVIYLGKGYRPLTRLDVLARFIEYKEAPLISLVTNIIRGRTAFGESVSIPKEIIKRYVPMVAQDLYELYQEGGIEAIPMGIPAFFGIGTQTYEGKKRK